MTKYILTYDWKNSPKKEEYFTLGCAYTRSEILKTEGATNIKMKVENV